MKYLDKFRVAPGSKVKLKDFDPAATDRGESRESARDELEHFQEELLSLQELLYAERKRSLLICLQAMDTGGKDGTIRHVFTALNPLGCRVAAFKQPSAEELSHDFLWRIHQQTPGKGEVAIFNRSHYEDVLVVRVHKLVPKDVWSNRYELINAFEKNLADAGTHILKFYLHISKEEQLRRLKDRLDDPAKQWKANATDYQERDHWDDYTEAYQDALSRCSTEYAPWFIIPADHKWFRNLTVGRIMIEYLKALGMEYPKPTADIKKLLREYHEGK